MTENEKYIYDNFLISINSGFLSLEDIIDETLEAVDDEGWSNEITEDWVRETISREYEKHTAASKTWQYPTDTDRLHDAFDKLCSMKIIALHNAGYTTSDATYDAQDVWKDLEGEGIKPIGYCYYHGQDLERVIQTGTLLIGFYGERANNEKEAIAIGNKVFAVLKEAGFNVEWNGSASKRIELQDFDWNNLFTSHDEVEEKWGYDRVFGLMAD